MTDRAHGGSLSLPQFTSLVPSEAPQWPPEVPLMLPPPFSSPAIFSLLLHRAGAAYHVIRSCVHKLPCNTISNHSLEVESYFEGQQYGRHYGAVYHVIRPCAQCVYYTCPAIPNQDGAVYHVIRPTPSLDSNGPLDQAGLPNSFTILDLQISLEISPSIKKRPKCRTKK